jgi:predicted RNA binding protein YcfA (HicA-like mRNA interferase family)
MTAYTNCKDMSRVVEKLVKEGWTYSQNTHGRITHPSGRYLTISITPSDKYAYRQLERDVRRLLKKLKQEGEI